MQRFELVADIKKICAVLQFIKEDMVQLKIDEHTQFNVAMVAEEIFSNIALYAYQEKTAESVVITTELIDDYYSITFSDHGKAYNPLTQADPDLSVDLNGRPIGGLGVFLSKKLSDDITYKRKNLQNILCIKFKLAK